MKPKTFGEAMASIILSFILIPFVVIAFYSETDSKSTAQAVVPCEFCEKAYGLFHKAAYETNHNTPDYYYTYKCEKCGNEFTIEIIQE